MNNIYSLFGLQTLEITDSNSELLYNNLCKQQVCHQLVLKEEHLQHDNMIFEGQVEGQVERLAIRFDLLSLNKNPG